MNRRPLRFGLMSAVLFTVGACLATSPASAARCPIFPKNNFWKADVRSLPVHPMSSAWVSNMGTPSTRLHPDFGPSDGSEPAYGIPITFVKSAHKKVVVTFDYADESDKVRYPLSLKTRIEGGWESDGDRHAIVVNRSRCRLYETWDTHRTASGQWHAGSGATWSLRSNKLRPDGWTSADAAGLPILPGLLRWKEVRAGSVRHAIRFTTDQTSAHHVWPARHDASDETSWSYPPMGARFRLDASFPEAGFSPYARAVIAAMKTYGLVLADNGSPWFFQGEQNAGWPPSLINELKQIPANAFVAVDTAQLPHTANSAAVG